MAILHRGRAGMVGVPAVLAALACAGSALAGCSAVTPDPVQFAALAIADGSPTAVVITCGQAQVEVSVRTPVDANGATSLWSVVVTVPDGASTIDVELLGEPRPGWEIVPVPASAPTRGTGGGRPEVTRLTSIDDGQEYVLDAARPATQFQDAPLVTFTTDDFAKIGSNEVLAATDYGKVEVISRDSFVERTRCD
jgi:hypothetical protein